MCRSADQSQSDACVILLALHQATIDIDREASQGLIAHGFSYIGKDMLYSGLSGEPLKVYLFTGPVFYQKLKHMVADKMHARSSVSVCCGFEFSYREGNGLGAARMQSTSSPLSTQPFCHVPRSA